MSDDDLVEVRIIGLPPLLARQAQQHFDELRREFLHLANSDESLRQDVPGRLLALSEDVRNRFGSFGDANSELMDAAADRGEAALDLTYQLPAGAGPAAAELDALLEEVDRYCESGDYLLTLKTPPRALAYRRWFLGQFVDQIDGQPPIPFSEWVDPSPVKRSSDLSIGTEFDLRHLLSLAENTPPVDSVDAVAEELRRTVGGRHVSLLITNFSGSGLVRLSYVVAAADSEDGHNERVESVALPGSVHETVMRRQEPSVVATTEGWLVLVPITERGDAIGLLETLLDDEPDAATVEFVGAAAHAFAYLLIASRRHTDVYEWAQRDVTFSLAAEIQRRLLPSAYTVEGGHFTLAGWLEPAHSAGGDTFDYSLDREYLYASVTDAMGHGVEAALLATLVVGSLRNSRRVLATPAEQADVANAAMLENARGDQFVTGQLLRIRLADGTVEFVNAGHPNPYLIRGGRAAEIDLIEPQQPFGILPDPYRTQTSQLLAGDRLVLVTDGYLERNAVRLDLSDLLNTTVDHHPREVVRGLADKVLAATDGNLLDDATILCIDWHGPTKARDAANGADRSA